MDTAAGTCTYNALLFMIMHCLSFRAGFVWYTYGYGYSTEKFQQDFCTSSKMINTKICTHNDYSVVILKNCYNPPAFVCLITLEWFICLTQIILDIQFVQLIMWPQEDVAGKKWPFMGIVGQSKPVSLLLFVQYATTTFSRAGDSSHT